VARFHYLQLGLGVLLIAIAAKLVYGETTGDKIPTALTLGAIVAVLSVAIGASLLRERRTS
jgi:predicted tellurium resistance membrane protein TerC